MKRLLCAFVALSIHALLAFAQMQQPLASPQRPVNPLEKLLMPPAFPPMTPAQMEAAKVANEARRTDFEHMLTLRFVVNGNEVYDKKTNLTWQRCNYGQTWDEHNRWCKGVTKHQTITQASAEVAKEMKSWRIPEISEVLSLLQVACENTKVRDAHSAVFPEILSDTHYLSYSIREDQKSVNAAQCFGSKVFNFGVGKGYAAALRLVRSGR
jgi:hypothetical protein